MANSVDPDQMLHSAASDLGLHCLQRPICPSTEGNYGIISYCVFTNIAVSCPHESAGSLEV